MIIAALSSKVFRLIYAILFINRTETSKKQNNWNTRKWIKIIETLKKKQK